MFEWLNPLNLAARIQYRRNLRKSQKQTDLVARGLLELHYLAVTCHGRHQLSMIIMAAKEGEIEIDPIIVNMYSFFMANAPYQAYATTN